ncbi:phosphatidate cytidylyltransferase [Caulobacter sp. UNC279MFTsu5.1]|uniref:phosphatidate cytidylyltransferase n=1 Tax=Caulobacter sp. UNC279MFTsu5.1 TaxID=1502775 RepID=UPI0008EA0A37|nr:phosphatidate cytidylyltransferase [Caulobacter sp. UNC279MFTsu5.1]SFK11624.1 phosphatidate cytidylyltransferase [Caulobacter sp. UNC279MFTsu5.1]
MTSPSPAKRFNWSNLRIRVASATVLVPTVVAAVWFGDVWYLGLILVGVALLAREWAEMSARRSVLGVALAIGAAVAISVIVAFRGHYYITWPVVVVGAVAAALMARGAVERRADAAYGVIYIAPAVIAMIWLRRMDAGLSWTLLMFTVTWFADIFAFAVGSLLKGPKLWPRYSPNKTWSGFFGGLVAASLGAIGIVALSQLLPALPDLHLAWPVAAAIGLLGGLATMAGDLWESMLKRRFGVKDSGDLIPGHGGMLDRVDGLMFAAIVVAGARLLDQWGWLP